ncbi:hypothetical protein AKJ16_DCAP12684 [Drosera capensis]
MFAKYLGHTLTVAYHVDSELIRRWLNQSHPLSTALHPLMEMTNPSHLISNDCRRGGKSHGAYCRVHDLSKPLGQFLIGAGLGTLERARVPYHQSSSTLSQTVCNILEIV